MLLVKLIKPARFEENREYDVLYSLAPVTGYTDSSNSITAWDCHGQQVKDYKFVRAEIKSLAGDLSGLSIEEKTIAAQWMCPDPSDPQVSGILGAEYHAYLQNWIDGGKASRLIRWEKMKATAFGLISEGYQALNEVLNDNLHEKYLEGIESLSEDGVDGLKDWVASTNIYSATGLLNGGYTPKNGGQTINDVSLILLSILEGN